MYDAGNRKDIRRAEKAAAASLRARQDYTRRVMSDTFGREWMYNLLLRCNIFHTPFVRGSIDATSFNCGGQNIGLQLFADVVTVCPSEYILMIQEASHKELANDRRDSDNRSTSPGEHDGSPDSGRDVEGPIAGEYDPYATDGE